MAVKVTSTDTLKLAMRGCIELEKSKRGLGKLFHTAVVELLNENPDMTGDELGKAWLEAVAEVENTLRGEIVDALGEYDKIEEVLPSWRQYKSDIKRAFEMVDRRDLIKCGTFSDIKAKLQEVRDAMKEKAAGESGGEPAENGGGKAGDSLDLSSIPASARPFLREAMKALTSLGDDDAAEVAENFKNAAFGRMRNLSKAKKKLSGVNGGANKAAANA